MKPVIGSLVLLCVLSPLTGCVTSSALTFASLGASGLSVALSGKTPSDHVLSLALNRDCALVRKLRGAPLCRTDVSPAAPLPPLGPSMGLSGESLAGNTTTPEARPEPRIRRLAPAPRVAQTEPDPAERGRLFAVVGSFENQVNARRLVEESGHTRRGSARVVTAMLPVGLRHRVVIGPLHEPSDFRAGLAAAGFSEGWPLRLCADLSPPPCGDHDLHAAALTAPGQVTSQASLMRR